MTFDRPYDRSSIGTNAYGIAPAIAPAIGFDRLFDRVCSIPPHPYARSKRSPRPWVAASAALAWKGRAERADYRQACRNARKVAALWCIMLTAPSAYNRYVTSVRWRAEEKTSTTPAACIDVSNACPITNGGDFIIPPSTPTNTHKPTLRDRARVPGWKKIPIAHTGLYRWPRVRSRRKIPAAFSEKLRSVCHQ